jgi:hypothetical protein
VGEAIPLHRRWHEELAAREAYGRKPPMETDDL